MTLESKKDYLKQVYRLDMWYWERDKKRSRYFNKFKKRHRQKNWYNKRCRWEIIT